MILLSSEAELIFNKELLIYECLIYGCLILAVIVLIFALSISDMLNVLLVPLAIITFPIWFPVSLFIKSGTDCEGCKSCKEYRCEERKRDIAGYRKEYLENKEKRDEISEQVRDILSKGGRIRLCRESPDICFTFMPDGEVGFVSFGCNIREYLTTDAPERIVPGADPDGLLISPDVMVMRKGKYRYEAAEHLVKKTEEACSIFENSVSLYIPEGGRTLIGIDDDGEVRSVMLDLPVSCLFWGLEEANFCRDNIYGLLIGHIKSGDGVIGADIQYRKKHAQTGG